MNKGQDELFSLMRHRKIEQDELDNEVRRLIPYLEGINETAHWLMQSRLLTLFDRNNPLCLHSRIAIYETNLLICFLRGWAYPNHDIMSGKRVLLPSEVKAKIAATPNLWGCCDTESTFSTPIPIRKKKA